MISYVTSRKGGFNMIQKAKLFEHQTKGLMNKKPILILLSVIFILILSNLASAVIFDVAAARQEEWERYEAYREDYVKFHDLEAFSGYISEYNLQRNFGFYGPDYYYIPPDVWRAKYNPPLQGDVYYTYNRGYTTSLYQPSAVRFYGDEINGRYAGYIPSTSNGKYFDHPHMYGAPGYLTMDYPYYGGYGGYDYNGYGYNFNEIYSEEPAYYARIAEPLSNGFYVVGFY